MKSLHRMTGDSDGRLLAQINNKTKKKQQQQLQKEIEKKRKRNHRWSKFFFLFFIVKLSQNIEISEIKKNQNKNHNP